MKKYIEPKLRVALIDNVECLLAESDPDPIDTHTLVGDEADYVKEERHFGGSSPWDNEW